MLSRIEQINILLQDDDLAVRPVYITEHSDFGNVCLCRAVLMVTLHSHRYHYGSVDEPVTKTGVIIQCASVIVNVCISIGDSGT